MLVGPYDREVMRVHNLVSGKPPPSLWDRDLRVLVWSEVMLCIFAVGGVFFCFDKSREAAVTSWILFFCGGCIKVGLLAAEVLDMALGTNCAGGRGSGVDICGGGDDEDVNKDIVPAATMTTATRDNTHTTAEATTHTAALLGDPGDAAFAG